MVKSGSIPKNILSFPNDKEAVMKSVYLQQGGIQRNGQCPSELSS